jgi:two-component system, LuxR family, sensor kinase FixL
VLLNLIVNGMDAMADTAEASRQLTVRTDLSGTEHVEVTVVDRGHGISEEQMPHLFDSFFTTKPDGMGLGLSIARSIIEVHQGQIWAENRAGGGAAFHFTLRATRSMTA